MRYDLKLTLKDIYRKSAIGAGSSRFQIGRVKGSNPLFSTLLRNTEANRSLTYWKKVIEREDNSRESTECFESC